jgi:pimeloyl-ACP methyl ester carboxylesterase
MAWAELADVRSYYEVIGEGEPLLLIPGLGATVRVWDPVAPLLAEHFSLVMADNRGIGHSEARRKPRTLRDYAADLADLLDALQVERAHVLGLSLGGIIAQRLAIDHPDRINRLVLMSCADQFSTYLTRMAALLGHSLRRFSRPLFLQTMELLGTAPLYMDEHVEEIDRATREKCRKPSSARAMGTQLRCLLRSRFDETDYHIAAPTLVISGEHDVLIPSCYGRQMARKLPHSQFVLLEGAGHNPLAEVPETVVPLIVRFLGQGNVGVPAESLS